MDSVCIVKNGIIEKLPDNVIDTNSWSLIPNIDNFLTNEISYTKLNQNGIKLISDENILGYDIKKMILVKKGTNTVISNFNSTKTYTRILFDNDFLHKSKKFELNDIILI